MKTFEISHKLENKIVSVLKYTNTKLHTGMVFKIKGDKKLKDTYVVTVQKRAICKDCPLSVPMKYMPRISACSVYKQSKGGRIHAFCKKDLRSEPQGDNAFTIKKLDTIIEGL